MVVPNVYLFFLTLSDCTRLLRWTLSTCLTVPKCVSVPSHLAWLYPMYICTFSSCMIVPNVYLKFLILHDCTRLWSCTFSPFMFVPACLAVLTHLVWLYPTVWGWTHWLQSPRMSSVAWICRLYSLNNLSIFFRSLSSGVFLNI